jgi:hypothetical protein
MDSGSFTYPEMNKIYEKLYLGNPIKYLEIKDENKLIAVLKDSKCNIIASTNYSRKRWNAYSVEVYFYIPFSKISDIDSKKQSEIDDILQ